MRIPLDRHGRSPLYRQVASWLRESIADGSLPPGTRLPSTRALADDLEVSRITVATAYAELETDGLLEGRPGSGSYVAAAGPAPSARERNPDEPWPLWQRDLGERRQRAAGPAFHPPAGLISFVGVTDPRRYPLRDLARTFNEVLRTEGADAAGYGDFTQGHGPLRETVTQLLASQGIHTTPGQVLITSGSQQGLALVCGALVGRGDAVIVEEPTYNLALGLFSELDVRVVGVPADDDGLRVDDLEARLQQHHPKLIFTMPNFQNPSGVSLSGPRRRVLLELADRYNVPIVEDDFTGDLRYDGRAQPAIKALDANGQVIYLGTFSKLVVPAMRVGYLVADGPILQHLARRKRYHDLTTSPLLQRVLDRYLTVGRYQAELRRTTRVCRARRDALVDAVATLPGVAMTPPRGGLFAWLRLPAGVDARELRAVARREGVDFSPGDPFFTDPAAGAHFARVNFAVCTPDEIDEGIARLAQALDQLHR